MNLLISLVPLCQAGSAGGRGEASACPRGGKSRFSRCQVSVRSKQAGALGGGAGLLAAKARI